MADYFRARRGDSSGQELLGENGWSLLGLAESLRAEKKNEQEAAKTKAKFENV
jgi:hypothetical protein